MTDTVFVVHGFTSYHVDPGCNALDSARLNVRGGTVRVATAQEAADNGRPACIVCSVPAGATEWTVTETTVYELWELIDPSKPHYGHNLATGRAEIDGLTIWAHAGQPKQVARFGDRITVSRGRYTVHPATQETQR